MKRMLSCPAPEQTRGRPSSPKRRKPTPSNSDSCEPSNAGPSPRTLPLTPETLQLLSTQLSAAEISTSSVEEWASGCNSYGELEMAPPPSPSIMSTDSSLRRASKLGYRRQRSQSPTKSSTQYRSRNMAEANIFVDHFHDPPPDVEAQLKTIFSVSTLEDIGHASIAAEESILRELAEKYRYKSRQMAKKCAGEGQWKGALLTGLLEPMQGQWPDTLMLSSSEKPWISKLRPVPPSLEDLLNSERPLPTPPEAYTPTAEPPFPPSFGAALPQTPILRPPSNTTSELTTDDPNRVSVPKPDISVGFDHASFTTLHGKILWRLQEAGCVLSEPHQSGIGMHFPFLVIETKGSAPGSNMLGGQNQAAVGGACALRILGDLKLAAGTAQNGSRQIVFAVVTEGPIHELWVLYQVEEAYHMTLLQTWRTTMEKGGREFVYAMLKVLEWGVGDFRGGILKELTAIETEMIRERTNE